MRRLEATTWRGIVGRFTVPARWAIAAIVLGLFALAAWLPGLIVALRAPEPVVPASAGGGGVEQSARYSSYIAQFDGRSLFFVPSPPAPPPVDPPRETGPTTPPPPTRYGGPSLIALVNDTAWFSDGRRLAAGGDKDGTLRVIRIDAPWNALVEWQGVEFTVSLFDRDQVVWREDRPAPPSTTAPPSAPSSVAEQPTQSPTEAAAEQDGPTTTTAEAPPLSDATPNGQEPSPEQE